MTYKQIAVGEVLAGRYRVERELGAGGMGVVYAAHHLELDQPVALKVITASIADLAAANERFRREVRAAAKIRSEHVARVLDVGALDNGMPFMVLEYLLGNDLERELRLRGRLPCAEAIDYLLQAIEAIAEAHAAGIIHRDLKPANLFLAERADKTRIVKVLDFGISKSLHTDPSIAQASLTQTGMALGSPLYMAPEQMQAVRDPDHRCDIWSLGVVLYQMLSGNNPFGGDSIVELCTAILESTPARLSKLRSDIPVGIDAIIGRCLERNRNDRYADVGQLALALAVFGPAHSRIHSERAARVLNPIQPKEGGQLPTSGSADVARMGPSGAKNGATPAGPSRIMPSDHTSKSAVPVSRAVSQASAGGAPAATRTTRKWLLVAGVVAVIAVAVGTFAATKHDDASPMHIAVSSAVLSVPTVVDSRVPGIANGAESIATGAAIPANGAESNATGAAIPAIVAGSPNLPVAARTPIVGAGRSVMPVRPARAPKTPEPVRNPTEAAKPADNGLPDYGGRR